MRRERADDGEMLAEYDFSDAVIGKYAEQYDQETNIVLIESDLAGAFPTSESVNDALRELLRIRGKAATPARGQPRG